MDTAKLADYDQESYALFISPRLIQKDLSSLSGIIKGIICDKEINEQERNTLKEWITDVKQYEDRQPYRSVISLIRNAILDNVLTEEESSGILWFCNQYCTQNNYLTELTAGIQTLSGIINGISMDGNINLEELKFLDNWMETNEYLKNTWPYDEIYNVTTKILSDHQISESEHSELLTFCRAISGDFSASTKESLSLLSAGFYQIDPQINFQEKTFCITGVSKKFKRKELAEKIELYGGFIQSSVSKTLNYLVVCDEKNSCWAFTCYGKKIEEVMSHRKKGLPIIIIHEFDLEDAFQNF